MEFFVDFCPIPGRWKSFFPTFFYPIAGSIYKYKLTRWISFFKNDLKLSVSQAVIGNGNGIRFNFEIFSGSIH